jgi:hypothetical protein
MFLKQLTKNITMKIWILLPAALILVALTSGCVTRNAVELVFTSDDLESIGYNVLWVATFTDNVYKSFEGFESAAQREYQLVDSSRKPEGQIIFLVIVFDSEANAGKFFPVYAEQQKSCPQSPFGDEGYCCEVEGRYDCTARYGKHVVFLRYDLPGRTLKDAEDLMEIFENKIG